VRKIAGLYEAAGVTSAGTHAVTNNSAAGDIQFYLNATAKFHLPALNIEGNWLIGIPLSIML
jgi:hypothetical protein